MTTKMTPMEILKLLEQSNCRECGEKTCLAFAASVFKGNRRLDECPRLDPDTIARYSSQDNDDAGEKAVNVEAYRDEFLESMKQTAAAMDLAEAAERTGGKYANNKLTLKIMGKDFSVDTNGRIISEIHANPWVTGPFLDYVLNSRGKEPTGNWVVFRELKEGRERYPLFQKRCEEAMKQVADAYPDLFNDIVFLFSGKKVNEQFAADVSVILRPLPKVPMMICYWLPEDGMDSSLNVFFDETADENLSIGSIFSLGAGLAQMFFKLAQRHGYNIEQSQTS
ncbi:MAG: DUF3786 domain-containing protein [Desulfosudaceae bacterium]